MGFDYKPHIMKLKGKEYLPVAARIAWLRSEHPGAQIETELVTLDLDAQLAVFKATVVIPETGARASDYGSETAKDFADYVEKASTKAIGRAIAALGYGTLMALELDEGERVVDSPAVKTTTTPATRSAPRAVMAAVPQPATEAPTDVQEPAQGHDGGLPRSAADWTGDQLRQAIEEKAGRALLTGPAWKALARDHGVPEPTSAAELGSRTWLLGLYQALRAAEYQEMIASVDPHAPDAENRVTGMVAEALAERDRRCIGLAHYDEIWAKGEARKAELSAPLLTGPRAQVAS